MFASSLCVMASLGIRLQPSWNTAAETLGGCATHREQFQRVDKEWAFCGYLFNNFTDNLFTSSCPTIPIVKTFVSTAVTTPPDTTPRDEEQAAREQGIAIIKIIAHNILMR